MQLKESFTPNDQKVKHSVLAFNKRIYVIDVIKPSFRKKF